MVRLEENSARLNSDLAQLVRVVENRFGLKLHSGLHAALSKAAFAMISSGTVENVAEVTGKILRGNDDDPVIQRMREAASIGETYFFRAPEQLKVLESMVLKHIVEPKRARGNRTLKMWSAACATGEEPYTLAMIFRQALPEFDVTIVASDMNEKSLAFARRGIYRGRSFRQVRPESMNGAVKPFGSDWEISKDIKKMVSFVKLNLVTDILPSPEKMIYGLDVAVCRNVLIYLDGDRLPNVVQRMTESCSPRCLFVITPAEYSAARHAKGFRDVSQGILLRVPMVPVAVVSSTPSRPVSTPKESLPTFSPRTNSPILKSQTAFAHALTRAKEAANRGASEESRTLLANAIALRPDSAQPFYLLAILHINDSDPKKAIREFQRALFLDRNFVGAELGLAQARVSDGQLAEGRLHFQRALRLMESMESPSLLEAIDITVAVARRVALNALAESPPG